MPTPYQRGCHARYDGVPLSANPFTESHEYWEWVSGWMEADADVAESEWPTAYEERFNGI